MPGAILKVYNGFSWKIHDTQEQFLKNADKILALKQYAKIKKDIGAKANEAKIRCFAQPALLILPDNTGIGRNDKSYTLTLGERDDLKELFYKTRDALGMNADTAVPKTSEIRAEDSTKKRIRIPSARRL